MSFSICVFFSSSFEIYCVGFFSKVAFNVIFLSLIYTELLVLVS